MLAVGAEGAVSSRACSSESNFAFGETFTDRLASVRIVAEGAGSGFGSVRITRPHLSGIVAMVVAASFSVWLVVSQSGSWTETAVQIGSPATTTTAAAPNDGALTSTELKAQVLELSAGRSSGPAPSPRRRYELTTDAAGEVGVR